MSLPRSNIVVPNGLNAQLMATSAIRPFRRGVSSGPPAGAVAFSTYKDIPILIKPSDFGFGTGLYLTENDVSSLQGKVYTGGRATMVWHPNGAFDSLPDNTTVEDTFSVVLTDGVDLFFGNVTITVMGLDPSKIVYPTTATEIRDAIYNATAWTRVRIPSGWSEKLYMAYNESPSFLPYQRQIKWGSTSLNNFPRNWDPDTEYIVVEPVDPANPSNLLRIDTDFNGGGGLVVQGFTMFNTGGENLIENTGRNNQFRNMRASMDGGGTGHRAWTGNDYRINVGDKTVFVNLGVKGLIENVYMEAGWQGLIMSTGSDYSVALHCETNNIAGDSLSVNGDHVGIYYNLWRNFHISCTPTPSSANHSDMTQYKELPSGSPSDGSAVIGNIGLMVDRSFPSSYQPITYSVYDSGTTYNTDDAVISPVDWSIYRTKSDGVIGIEPSTDVTNTYFEEPPAPPVAAPAVFFDNGGGLHTNMTLKNNLYVTQSLTGIRSGTLLPGEVEDNIAIAALPPPGMQVFSSITQGGSFAYRNTVISDNQRWTTFEGNIIDTAGSPGTLTPSNLVAQWADQPNLFIDPHNGNYYRLETSLVPNAGPPQLHYHAKTSPPGVDTSILSPVVSSLGVTDTLSIEYRVSIDLASFGVNQDIFSIPSNARRLRLASSGELQLICDGAPGTFSGTPGDIPSNTMVTILLMFDGPNQEARVYVNNVLKVTDTSGAPYSFAGTDILRFLEGTLVAYDLNYIRCWREVDMVNGLPPQENHPFKIINGTPAEVNADPWKVGAGNFI